MTFSLSLPQSFFSNFANVCHMTEWTCVCMCGGTRKWPLFQLSNGAGALLLVPQLKYSIMLILQSEILFIIHLLHHTFHFFHFFFLLPIKVHTNSFPILVLMSIITGYFKVLFYA